ncbi:MAG: EamA family transporter [Actinobacteria bacterium]|nr:EamA family transporter [Actinomycetota bacterium]
MGRLRSGVAGRSADLMLVITMTFWGGNFTATKYAITHGVHPLAYSSSRYTIAAIIFFGLSRVFEGSVRIARNDFGVLALCAVGLVANQVCFIYALRYTSTASAALLFGTMPIFAALISFFAGIERPTRRFAIAAVVSLVGVVFVAVGTNGSLSSNLKGDALTMVAVITWAFYSVMATPMMTRYSPIRLSAYAFGCTSLVMLAIATPQLKTQTLHLSHTVWATYSFAVVLSLVFANVLWFRSIKIIGPSRASLFSNLQFFLAALFGVLLLSEKITVLQVLGGVTIGVAILLSRPRGSKLAPVESVE